MHEANQKTTKMVVTNNKIIAHGLIFSKETHSYFLTLDTILTFSQIMQLKYFNCTPLFFTNQYVHFFLFLYLNYSLVLREHGK